MPSAAEYSAGPPNFLDDLHIRLFDAQCFELAADTWNSRDVQDSFWRFYMNNRDGAALQLSDRQYSLRTGQLYFVPAGVRFSCQNVASVEHFFLHFDVLGVPAAALRELFAEPVCLADETELQTTTRALAQQIKAGSPTDTSLRCRFKALLYNAMSAYLDSLPPPQKERCWILGAAYEPVLPAIRYIEDNIGANLSNAALAKLCSFNEDYFVRRFAQCVGQTPARYIRRRRVTLAAQQLIFSASSIEAIAERFGFGNRFHFSRVFADLMGNSPAAYRKMYRV